MFGRGASATLYHKRDDTTWSVSSARLTESHLSLRPRERISLVQAFQIPFGAASTRASLQRCIIQQEYDELEKLLVQKRDKINKLDEKNHAAALHYAAAKGDEYALEKILATEECNVGVLDGRGRTALMWAVISSSLGCATRLLQRGIDVTIRDEYNYTALHYAVASRNISLVSAVGFVSASESYFNQQGSDNSVFHHAVLSDNLNPVSTLLASGLDPNLTDSRGMTPLHLAVLHGHATVVRLLIPVTDVLILDDEEKTALDYSEPSSDWYELLCARHETLLREYDRHVSPHQRDPGTSSSGLSPRSGGLRTKNSISPSTDPVLNESEQSSWLDAPSSSNISHQETPREPPKALDGVHNHTETGVITALVVQSEPALTSQPVSVREASSTMPGKLDSASNREHIQSTPSCIESTELSDVKEANMVTTPMQALSAFVGAQGGAETIETRALPRLPDPGREAIDPGPRPRCVSPQGQALDEPPATSGLSTVDMHVNREELLADPVCFRKSPNLGEDEVKSPTNPSSYENRYALPSTQRVSEGGQIETLLPRFSWGNKSDPSDSGAAHPCGVTRSSSGKSVKSNFPGRRDEKDIKYQRAWTRASSFGVPRGLPRETACQTAGDLLPRGGLAESDLMRLPAVVRRLEHEQNIRVDLGNKFMQEMQSLADKNDSLLREVERLRTASEALRKDAKTRYDVSSSLNNPHEEVETRTRAHDHAAFGLKRDDFQELRGARGRRCASAPSVLWPATRAPQPTPADLDDGRRTRSVTSASDDGSINSAGSEYSRALASRQILVLQTTNHKLALDLHIARRRELEAASRLGAANVRLEDLENLKRQLNEKERLQGRSEVLQTQALQREKLIEAQRTEIVRLRTRVDAYESRTGVPAGRLGEASARSQGTPETEIPEPVSSIARNPRHQVEALNRVGSTMQRPQWAPVRDGAEQKQQGRGVCQARKRIQSEDFAQSRRSQDDHQPSTASISELRHLQEQVENLNQTLAQEWNRRDELDSRLRIQAEELDKLRSQLRFSALARPEDRSEGQSVPPPGASTTQPCPAHVSTLEEKLSASEKALLDSHNTASALRSDVSNIRAELLVKERLCETLQEELLQSNRCYNDLRVDAEHLRREREARLSETRDMKETIGRFRSLEEELRSKLKESQRTQLGLKKRFAKERKRERGRVRAMCECLDETCRLLGDKLKAPGLARNLDLPEDLTGTLLAGETPDRCLGETLTQDALRGCTEMFAEDRFKLQEMISTSQFISGKIDGLHNRLRAFQLT